MDFWIDFFHEHLMLLFWLDFFSSPSQESSFNHKNELSNKWPDESDEQKCTSDCQDAGVQPMGGSEEAIAEPQQFLLGGRRPNLLDDFFCAAKHWEKKRKKNWGND